MTTQPAAAQVDISELACALVIEALDSIYMEAAEDSPNESATLDAMSIIEALRSALTASGESFDSIRVFAQDCIENGHDRGHLANLYAIRDLCDAMKEKIGG